MRVLIVGGGLVGVTSAYFLARQGCEVLVVDRREGPALETSFANGGLLTPSMSDPWNSPGCWRVLLSSLGRQESPMQLRMRAIPALAQWGVKFLRNSTKEVFERNKRRNLQLAQYSLHVMAALRRETGIAYGRKADGSLRIFRNVAAFEHATRVAEAWRRDGLGFRRMTTPELVNREPALGPIAGGLAGALYYEDDEVGDAYRFCVEMTQRAEQLGARFRFGSAVLSLNVDAGRIIEVVTHEERFTADRYLVAAGSYSTDLLREAGLRLSVEPVKGYSLTIDCPHDVLHLPIVDDDLHAVLTPLEGILRVAGTAEFAGRDFEMRPARVRYMEQLVRTVLPHAALDLGRARPWCGLRAMSSDGVPIIGGTPVANLFVNTGHGHLGWTMAAGSAQLVTDLLRGNPPAIDPVPYAWRT